MNTFFGRHATKVRGHLSCFDWVVLTGIPLTSIAWGPWPSIWGALGFRLFDCPRSPDPFHDDLRTGWRPTTTGLVSSLFLSSLVLAHQPSVERVPSLRPS